MSDGKTRVLVVEDDAEMRRALALNLTARGYQISTAADGAPTHSTKLPTRPRISSSSISDCPT